MIKLKLCFYYSVGLLQKMSSILESSVYGVLVSCASLLHLGIAIIESAYRVGLRKLYSGW